MSDRDKAMEALLLYAFTHSRRGFDYDWWTQQCRKVLGDIGESAGHADFDTRPISELVDSLDWTCEGCSERYKTRADASRPHLCGGCEFEAESGE